MITRRELLLSTAAGLGGLSLAPRGPGAEGKKFPPGWLPVNTLDAKAAWPDVRKVEDKVQLYLPRGDKPVRGVFLCVVFHSGDPREVARLWDFALVTVPWPMLWDLGLPDKRSPRPKKTGLPMGDMGVMLRYLEAAAKETKHPELAAAPIVGWMMQGGNHHASDLYKHAPERVIAWSDSFPKQLAKHPEVYKSVPFALAWEFGPREEKERRAGREKALPKVKGKPTPAPDLRCQANTYGFKHGVYSKFNFFMSYLDRCIAARMPDELPAPGKPVKLKPVDRAAGWCADFNEVGEWVAIAPQKKAQGMVAPMWLPDEYAAWMYRSFHSANPDLRLTAPAVEYRAKGDRKDCGLGYGAPLRAGAPLKFAAELKGEYAKVEFHDGGRVVGVAAKAPWEIKGVKLERGLRALFAVGVTADGRRRASRPAFVAVE